MHADDVYTESDFDYSEQAWLVEWEVASLDRLTKRLESFLRLRLYSTRDAELYQVANYGMSGQYNTHHDAVLLDKRSRQHKAVFNIDNGDRIATVSYTHNDI